MCVFLLNLFLFLIGALTAEISPHRIGDQRAQCLLSCEIDGVNKSLLEPPSQTRALANWEEPLCLQVWLICSLASASSLMEATCSLVGSITLSLGQKALLHPSLW